eukprot:10521509-Alexandrium_andersonii.AAC.1
MQTAQMSPSVVPKLSRGLAATSGGLQWLAGASLQAVSCALSLGGLPPPGPPEKCPLRPQWLTGGLQATWMWVLQLVDSPALSEPFAH